MRLLISSVVVRCVLGSLALLLLVACQSDEQKLAQFLERGTAYAEEGKLEEAVIEFKNVLKIDPNNAAAHHQLADVYLKLERFRETYWELSEAVRLDPTNRQARMSLSGLALAARDYETVLAQVDGVLELDPDDADATMVRGQALDFLDRSDEAEAAFLRAIELDPEDGNRYALLAGHYIFVENLEAAESTLVTYTELDPGVVSYSRLGRFLLMRIDRLDAAEVALKEAVSRIDADTDPARAANAWKQLGNLYVRWDRPDDAIAVLERGIEQADPGSEQRLDLMYVLARFHARQGDNEKADALIESTIADQPDSAQPYLILSSYRGSKGDFEGALQAAEEALIVEPDNTRAKLRKAEMLTDMGYREEDEAKVAEARSIVEQVLEQAPSDPEARFVLGKICLAEGDHVAATTELRTAIDGRPDWAQAHFILGSALMLQGETASARAELARAIELDAGLLEARRMLAKLHSSLGEHEYVIEQARAYLSRRPDNTEVRVLLAQSLVRVGRPTEAVKELEGVSEENRGLDVIFALGRLYLVQGQIEKAREFLLRANELSPNHSKVLASLTRIDYSLGKADEANARLEAAVKAEPDDAQLALLVGKTALSQRDVKAAEASFKRAIELDPDLLEAYQQLAALYHAQGRLDETIDTYKAALEAQPDSAQLHQFLAVLYEMSGNSDLAIQHYDHAIELDAGLGQAKNNLAYLLAEQERDLDRALDLAQDAKALMPDNPNASDTLGWVLFKRGMYSASVGYLKEAVAHTSIEEPSRGLILDHLAQAYEADNQGAKAIEVLEQMLSELEAQNAAIREQGGTPREPSWSTEARSRLERLRSAG